MGVDWLGRREEVCTTENRLLTPQCVCTTENRLLTPQCVSESPGYLVTMKILIQ